MGHAGHMAITLPTPLRVAAGILGTGIDRVRSLPEDLPALPVVLVGKAMRLSMRLQQEVAELATRGDQLIGGMLGGAALEESPPWARFDDDPVFTPTNPRSARSGPGRSPTRAGGGAREGEFAGRPAVTSMNRTARGVSETAARAAKASTPTAGKTPAAHKSSAKTAGAGKSAAL